jgi:hypothetical protein
MSKALESIKAGLNQALAHAGGERKATREHRVAPCEGEDGGMTCWRVRQGGLNEHGS